MILSFKAPESFVLILQASTQAQHIVQQLNVGLKGFAISMSFNGTLDITYRYIHTWDHNVYFALVLLEQHGGAKTVVQCIPSMIHDDVVKLQFAEITNAA